MDYLLENLGPDHFQEFAQALLLAEYPELQCLPVGHADGGRDAISYSAPDSASFAVFQVKYSREPAGIRDTAKWLIDAVSAERDNVAKLAERGAERYFLVTNVRGTAPLDSGEIDRVDSYLRAELPIPAKVLWRDEVNRRLDNAWNLKWAYPQLMTGADMLRSLVEEGLTEHAQRRTRTIRSFITSQLIADQEVRFKQIELQNRLSDLFVDVPATLTLPSGARRRERKDERVWFQIARTVQADTPLEPVDESEDGVHWIRADRRWSTGAARLLLHPQGQHLMPHVVLEGAPGQGKSTLSQFVCQVHRLRVLGKPELNDIDEQYRGGPLRLPFRVDLRDFATWLSGTDPFVPRRDGEERPEGWAGSLEAFLAALVRHHSGGASFSVDDVHAVAKVSALLVVLDGLDEVADAESRSDIVREIKAGVARMSEISASLQVVVTSRPAAFANSPGFSDQDFLYLELAPLTSQLISGYADKWIAAGGLRQREAADVRRILKERLDQPHLRDLARNPMQLAILLSLVHTRGASLPDKRTALYDAYVQLFFNRESEKSLVVRDHRDLLIDIHQFLGWRLHSQSELAASNGIIAESELRSVLKEYLAGEGHETTLVDDLFTGVVERVAALVSRVQGTFEFEVQPLREYFAARFLYETAPYSPTGAERQGTWPDRFDGIAKNFYWLNVARFFAGCLSKGELPALVDRLQALGRSPGYDVITHPQTLASMLLADWVFAQHPRSVMDVAKFIVGGPGQRRVVMTTAPRRLRSSELALPDRNGRNELLQACMQELAEHPPVDLAFDLVDVIRVNGGAPAVDQQWLDRTIAAASDDKQRWLDYGLWLGTLARRDATTLDLILGPEPTSRALATVLSAGNVNYVEAKPRAQHVVAAILGGDAVPHMRPSLSPLAAVASMLDPDTYSMIYRWSSRSTLSSYFKEVGGLNRWREVRVEARPSDAVPVRQCQELVRRLLSEAERPMDDWKTTLEPWKAIIDTAASMWGRSFALVRLAVIAAGIQSKGEKGSMATSLWDENASLTERVRYARLRAGTTKWWVRQIDEAPDLEASLQAILIAMAWASGQTLGALAPRVDAFLESASPVSIWKLTDTLRSVVEICQNAVEVDVAALPAETSPMLAALLSYRANDRSADRLFERFLRGYEGGQHVVVERRLQRYVIRLFRGKATWGEVLPEVKAAYAKGVSSPAHYFDRAQWSPTPRVKVLSYKTAREIALHPQWYPRELLVLAEAICRKQVVDRIEPVTKVATRDHWFSARPN